jgi:hypothetical protein
MWSCSLSLYKTLIKEHDFTKRIVEWWCSVDLDYYHFQKVPRLSYVRAPRHIREDLSVHKIPQNWACCLLRVDFPLDGYRILTLPQHD